MTYCSDVIFLSLNYSPGAFLAYYSFVLLVFGVYHKERLMGTDISKVKTDRMSHKKPLGHDNNNS